jgi:hypothetical protein
MADAVKYSITLNFEEISLPPFRDILVVGKNSPQGKFGLSKSFELLTPNGFEMIPIEDDGQVEAVLVNKRILVKMPQEKIIAILRVRVFPFISVGELLKVDFKVNVAYDSFTEE